MPWIFNWLDFFACRSHNKPAKRSARGKSIPLHTLAIFATTIWAELHIAHCTCDQLAAGSLSFTVFLGLLFLGANFDFEFRVTKHKTRFSKVTCKIIGHKIWTNMQTIQSRKFLQYARNLGNSFFTKSTTEVLADFLDNCALLYVPTIL
jgi:hypothetical protein